MTRILCATMLLITLAGTCGCQWAQSLAQPVGPALRAPYDLTLGRLFQPGEAQVDTGPVIDAVEAGRLGYGAPRWTRDLGLAKSDQMTQATVLDDLIVCVERPSNIVSCVAVRDGSLLWQQKPTESTDCLLEPTRLGDEILISSETHLFQLAAKDGRLVNLSRLEATVADRPVLVGRLAIYGGLNGRVFAHDTVTGYSAWSQHMSAGITVRPVAAGLNVFVTDSNGVYGMFDTEQGTPLWKGVTYGQISAAPTVSSLGVFVACEDQTLYALDRASGKDKWKYPAAKPLTSSPTVIANTLFLSEPGAGLVAMDAIKPYPGGEGLGLRSVHPRPSHSHA